MNKFTFTYPTKVYFGEGIAAEALNQELPKTGKTVMLAYGGGSVKKNGIYDEIKTLLQEAGKDIIELAALCRTLPIRKYRRVRSWHEKTMLISLLLSAAAA